MSWKTMTYYGTKKELAAIMAIKELLDPFDESERIRILAWVEEGFKK